MKPQFKIWNIEENKWYEPVYEAYMNKLHDLLISPSGELIERSMDSNGKLMTTHESIFPNRYEIVNYIRLKDCNGIELYEGDRVKIEDYIYEIKFSEQYLCYMFWKIDFLRLPEDGKDIPITWHSKYRIEKCGNKFENENPTT